MSLKQEHITEPRVIAIKSWIQCDGCGANMHGDQVETSKYGFPDPESFKPSFELVAGWIELSRGSYDRRVKVHACPKCFDSRVEDLFGSNK